MTRLDRRLRRLELMARPEVQPSLEVFWPDELTPCPLHTGCDLEVETGTRRRSVIHLSFEVPTG